MTEQTTEVWNPFDAPAERTFPLTSSGGRATATFRAWTAEERMAYEDATTTTLMTTDVEGGRTVRLGRMNALLVTSTLRSWSGFPEQLTRPATEAERERAREAGRIVPDVITENTDLRRLEHLQRLGPTTYAELVDLASQVQPLPGQEEAHAKAQAAREKAAQEANGTQTGTNGEGDEDGDAGDPSRTPSTPPAAEDASPATQPPPPPASPSASSTRRKRSPAGSRSS